MNSINDTIRLLRVYLVDDEELAIKRLSRLLRATGKVEIIGTNTDPALAIEEISGLQIDLLFLDIQMPEINGFQLLAQLPTKPPVVFTTAYDQYALQAFEVNSIDYLLKPIETEQLTRVMNKIEQLRAAITPVDWHAQLLKMAEQLSTSLQTSANRYLKMLPSRLGERIQLIEVEKISYIFAEDKLTFAATAEKNYVLDQSIVELEQKLDPQNFFRIHRATMLNLNYVSELDNWPAGRLIVRLKDAKRTELVVARDRVRLLKDRLGL